MVRGTDSNMPTVPNNQPQNINDKNTTKVESPSPLPINLGSTMLPITVLIIKYPAPTSPAVNGPCVISANNTAGTAAIIEPIHHQDS